jgi:hypothetical protein
MLMHTPAIWSLTLHLRIAADLVTETDKAVEDTVSSTLREKYPDYDLYVLQAHYILSICSPSCTIQRLSSRIKY